MIACPFNNLSNKSDSDIAHSCYGHEVPIVVVQSFTEAAGWLVLASPTYAVVHMQADIFFDLHCMHNAII